MRRIRVSPGRPTISVGLRVSVPLSQSLNAMASKLGVTKNLLVTTILEHELAQTDGEPPTWWEVWQQQRFEQDPLIGDGDVT